MSIVSAADSVRWSTRRARRPGGRARGPRGLAGVDQRHSVRRVRLYPGDVVVGAFAARYAAEICEARVDAAPRENTHLHGHGGVIGTVTDSYADLRAHPGDPARITGHTGRAWPLPPGLRTCTGRRRVSEQPPATYQPWRSWAPDPTPAIPPP